MFADIEADVYIMADGDLTYDPEAAPEWSTLLLAEQLDMVVGTRRHEEKDAYRGGHVLGNKLFTGLLAGLFGRSFTDIFSGYRVFSRRFVKSFPVLSSGFEIETEMSVHALELRMPVGEIETPTPPVRRSESKLSTFGDGWRILKTIVTLYRIERPVLFFGIIGAMLLIAARSCSRSHSCSTYLAHRPGAAVPDRDPGHGHDDRRGAVFLRRPDPRHRHPRPPEMRRLAYLAFPRRAAEV